MWKKNRKMNYAGGHMLHKKKKNFVNFIVERSELTDTTKFCFILSHIWCNKLTVSLVKFELAWRFFTERLISQWKKFRRLIASFAANFWKNDDAKKFFFCALKTAEWSWTLYLDTGLTTPRPDKKGIVTPPGTPFVRCIHDTCYAVSFP